MTAAETILIVDDDDGVRDLLATVMREAGYDTRVAGSGHEALELVESELPSLVIVDVNLPGMSGYALCNRLREQFGELLPIVFRSGTRTESFDRAGGMLIGADDYLIKPFDPDEVVARVQRLLIRAGAASLQPVEKRRLPYELTPREYEVLSLLMQGRTQGQIAKELFISPKTAATHIQHILGKLGVKSRAQAVALAAREHFGSNSRPSSPPRSSSGR